MKTIEIKATPREKVGKKETIKLRRTENVPCVLYGGGEENLHFYAHRNSFKNLVYTADSYIVKLDIGGAKHNAVLKDLQFHPVTDNILHIDFYRVYDDRQTVVEIPVELKGFAPGVQEGGKLKLESRRLTCRGLIKDFPEKLVIDISKLRLGKTIKVGDLSFENVELIDSPNNVVVSVKLTRAARGAAAAEGDETEGEAAEGDAPAADSTEE